MHARMVLPVFLFACGAAAGALARGAIDPPAPAQPADNGATRPASDALADARDFATGADAAPDDVVAMLESLSLALTQEAEYRMVLEEQIEALDARVDELQGQLGRRGAAVSDEQLKERLASRAQRGGPLTVSKLVQAGMDDTTALAFKSKVDDIAMQRLYLRDQAMREGWLGDPRYRDESRRLAQAQDNLRSEFGSENYDAYLYASGRPNRIEVQNVLANSPAYEAGLRAGDQILSYNGARTFQSNELRQATQGGRSGEMIPLQIVRDGQPLEVYVPRGPLGVQMIGRSVRPGS